MSPLKRRVIRKAPVRNFVAAPAKVRSKPRSEPARDDRRYRINLILLVILLVLTTLWFNRHLQLYFTQTVFLGGTLTLWGIWKVAQSWYSWAFGKESAAATHRYLARSAVTEALVIALFVTAVLWATTSSVYLRLSGGGSGTSSFKVNIDGGSFFLEGLEVSKEQPIAGRPFFLDFERRELEIQVVGTDLVLRQEGVDTTLRPWSRLDFDVPGDFSEKEYRLIRLIPGAGALAHLPAGEEHKTLYSLRLILGPSEQVVLDELRYRTIYLGAKEETLERLAHRSSVEQSLVDEIEALLASYTGMPEEEQKRQGVHLRQGNRFLETRELAVGDTFELEVFESSSEEPCWRSGPLVVSDAGVKTIHLAHDKWVCSQEEWES